MSTHSEKHLDETLREEVAEHRAVEGSRLSRDTDVLNPFPRYRKMREEDPVHYNEEEKLWVIFRYDDVLRIVNDSSTFSSERVFARRRQDEQMTEEEREAARSLLSTDPPRHRQLRNLISQAFTPRSIAQLTPRITEIVNERLDLVIDQGRMDIVGDLSYPLPVIVIAEMLGIPTSERDQFKRWSDAIVSPREEEAIQASREMRTYFKGIIEQRRKQPKDDLISDLIASQIDGQHLTEPELLSFCILLLVAGNETTTNLIGNAFLCFDEQPEVMDQMRADQSLIPSAIEEVLRYRSPVQLLVRAVATDTQIGKQPVRAGEVVVPCLSSANRDETQFPNPDVFDIRRTPNRHVSFGHGIHFCIGAPLARLETKIALTIMLERLTDIRRERDNRKRLSPLEPIQSTFVYGVKHLPVTFKRA